MAKAKSAAVRVAASRKRARAWRGRRPTGAGADRLERAARWLGRSVVVFSRWRRGPCPERTHLICVGGCSGRGGRPAPHGGGAAVRGRSLDGVPLGRRGGGGRPAGGQADARRAQAGDPGRGRSRAPAPGGREQPADPGRVPGSVGIADRPLPASLDPGSRAPAATADTKKRRRCAPPSRTAPQCRRSAKPGVKPWPASRPSAWCSSTRARR